MKIIDTYVDDTAWAMMDDRQRIQLERRIEDSWYQRIGQHLTDEQWVSMLMSYGKGK